MTTKREFMRAVVAAYVAIDTDAAALTVKRCALTVHTGRRYALVTKRGTGPAKPYDVNASGLARELSRYGFDTEAQTTISSVLRDAKAMGMTVSDAHAIADALLTVDTLTAGGALAEAAEAAEAAALLVSPYAAKAAEVRKAKAAERKAKAEARKAEAAKAKAEAAEAADSQPITSDPEAAARGTEAEAEAKAAEAAKADPVGAALTALLTALDHMTEAAEAADTLTADTRKALGKAAERLTALAEAPTKAEASEAERKAAEAADRKAEAARVAKARKAAEARKAKAEAEATGQALTEAEAAEWAEAAALTV